jgi:virulence-associated protein VagC
MEAAVEVSCLSNEESLYGFCCYGGAVHEDLVNCKRFVRVDDPYRIALFVYTAHQATILNPGPKPADAVVELMANVFRAIKRVFGFVMGQEAMAVLSDVGALGELVDKLEIVRELEPLTIKPASDQGFVIEDVIGWFRSEFFAKKDESLRSQLMGHAFAAVYFASMVVGIGVLCPIDLCRK